MPNIRTYEAPNIRLDPSERGSQGYDTAGRRVGPLYNAAAQDVRERGQLEAQAIRGRVWPFDIIELNRRAEEARKAAEGGFKVQTRGGSSRGGLALQGSGLGTTGGAVGTGYRSSRAHGEISAGAAGMARMARQMVGGQRIPMPPGNFMPTFNPYTMQPGESTSINGIEYPGSWAPAPPSYAPLSKSWLKEFSKYQDDLDRRANKDWGASLDEWWGGYYGDQYQGTAPTDAGNTFRRETETGGYAPSEPRPTPYDNGLSSWTGQTMDYLSTTADAIYSGVASGAAYLAQDVVDTINSVTGNTEYTADIP